MVKTKYGVTLSDYGLVLRIGAKNESERNDELLYGPKPIFKKGLYFYVIESSEIYDGKYRDRIRQIINYIIINRRNVRNHLVIDNKAKKFYEKTQKARSR